MTPHCCFGDDVTESLCHYRVWDSGKPFAECLQIQVSLCWLSEEYPEAGSRK
jgi:hypothetical protein